MQIGLPVLREALRGINGTILAYGQTGSGKTHSLLHQSAKGEEAGLLPRLVASLCLGLAFSRRFQMISSLEGRKGYRKAPKSSRNRRFGASKAGKWAETPRFLMVSQDVANVYDIEAAAVQVYNEQVDDLLNPDHQNGQGAPEKRCFVARFGAASRLFRCVLPGFSSFLSGFRL